MKLLIGLLLAAYLIPASVRDLKKKDMDVRVWGVFFAVSVLLLLISGEELLWWNRILGLLPGAFMLLISNLSHGAVGKGDAYVLLFMGFVLGLLSILEILFYALLACFAVAVFLFVKKKKKKRIAFIPFLTGSFVLCYGSVLVDYYL